MIKILVNTPSGTQEIIDVGNGGGYFDSARVLWDERQDGPLPAITLGGMKRVDGALVEDAALLAVSGAAKLTEDRAALLIKIDADTDAIYGAVQGNRGSEYQLAEMDATAYKAAGYTGTVPASVQAWATAKGKTATWAADDILKTATAWRGAMASIRSNRLAKKEAAKTATDLAPITAQWDGFVAYIKTALGVA